MKQTSWILLALLAICTYSCKEVTVDFSYAPENPKAGDTITFTNLTSGGEDYTWYFGDNSTSSYKNPTHIYKQVGTYTVTLRESKSKKSITHTVTVLDSIPGFTANTDSVYLFIPITFSSTVWNPYSHAVSYQWTLSENCSLQSGSLTGATISVYFTKVGEETISLQTTKDGITTTATRTFTIHNTPAPCLLIETPNGKQYSQRFFDPLWEVCRPLDYKEGEIILAAAQERVQQVSDSVENKIYYATNSGLKVKNANGQNVVSITTDTIRTMILSNRMNKLFFATSNAVYMMPLIHTENNQFQTTPKCIDNMEVKKLAVDEQKR